MKKSICFLLLMLFGHFKIDAQDSLNKPISIFDRFGKTYTLNQLLIPSTGIGTNSAAKPVLPPSPINPVITCQAGYFNIYFAVGCGMDGSTQADIDRRSVVCRVFTDISQFINSPLTSNGTYANILIENTNAIIPNASTSGVLGVGSSYYAEFFNPAAVTKGLIPGEVWKTIKLGQNSYIGTQPLSLSPYYSPNAYHGYMAFNFSNPGINWDVSLFSNTITPTQFDFYTNVFHEAMHMLGFLSNISGTGASTFGFNKSYYSYYDKFLTTFGGNPLISNGGNFCSKYGYNFNANTSDLVASCVGCAASCAFPDQSNCSNVNKYAGSAYNVPVYTPGCFEPGSSLSHFEDYCYIGPASNNLYFVLTNGVSIGPNSKKRYLKPEERSVLCDLGYNVNSIYNSPADGAFFNYTTSTCPGKDIAGMCDGLNSSNTVTLTCTNGGNVTVQNINSNDRNALGGYTCLEALAPSTGNFNITQGSFNQPFIYTPTSGPGLHVLRYIPRNAALEQGNITYIFIYVLPDYTLCPPSCNFVYNGKFENALFSPPFDTWINAACAWDNANGGTCDYFEQGTSNNVDIPCNSFVGYEPTSAVGGTHYAGLYCYHDPNNILFSNNEAMFSKLTSPLAPNTAYRLTFDVSNAEGRSGEAYPLQAYFSKDLGFLSNNAIDVNIPNPPMLFTSSNVFTVTSGWQQAVFDFTTGATTNGEEYIVLGNLTNNPGITKTASPPNTGPCVYGSQSGAYYYIDNVTLTSNSVIPTFSLANACTNQPILLNPLATPAGGTFFGPFVTNSGGNYTFNAPNVGSYSIGYTYIVAGCSYTIFKQITVGPPHVVSVSSNTNVICTNLSQTSAILTANSTASGVNYIWEPGSLSGNPVTVSPLSTTVYTVSGDNQGCISTATLAITVQTACCTTSVTPYTGLSALNGNTISTSFAFNYDISVSTNPVYLQATELQFAPGVKITVKPGGQLHIIGAHLYGCGTDLWQGIVVEDGGIFKAYTTASISPEHNLIEDAVVAVDMKGPNLATATYAYGDFLTIYNTTFNKNFIGISINSFSGSVQPYPYQIQSCVFTSRNLPFTPTSWPNVSTTSGGLRAVTNSTVGLQAPYLLNGYAPANLKNPYNSQPSHIGVKLFNVGLWTGTIQKSIQIGKTSFVTEFNLFDNLGQCIEATNSDVLCYNNVFQNTQQYTYDPPGPSPPFLFGGNGIRHTTNGDLNTQLDASAGSSMNMNFGNRFYNCHYAINCDYVFLLNVRFNTFRSTQTSANLSSALGNSGVVVRSNRFLNVVSDNNFANINKCINLTYNVNTYNYNSITGIGILADEILIQRNYIGSQTTIAAPITTQYVNQAISITAPLSTPFKVISASFAVTSNTINRVFRGIDINSVSKTTFAATTSTNTILLVDDNIFNSLQYGINYMDNEAGTMQKNNIDGPNLTNTLVKLFYCTNNSANPIICENTLNQAYTGFEFRGNNTTAMWRGNTMSNLQRGMVLISNGIIGTQGSSGNPIGCKWIGNWTGNFGTWVEVGCNANLSPMYFNGPGPFAPPNNGGPGIVYISPANLIPTNGVFKSCTPTGPTKGNGNGNNHGNAKEIVDEELADQGSGWSVNILPNPASDNVSLASNIQEEQLEMIIIDINGKIVYQNKVNVINYQSNIKLDLENGMYFVTISNAHSEKEVKKLLIVK
jgi:hypothetical protein